MKSAAQNPFDSPSDPGASSDSSAFEETLRLIARLPAPEGIEERVQSRLRTGSLTTSGKAASCPAVSSKARILHWPKAQQLESAWARMAVAAAIVFVVAGGGWCIYSRIQPVQPQVAVALPRVGARGGFSSAGAMRTPQTLNGPLVAPAAVVVAPQKVTPAVNPAKQARRAQFHRGKPASTGATAPAKPDTPAKSAAAQPVAPVGR
jgi:hypothetical protein